LLQQIVERAIGPVQNVTARGLASLNIERMNHITILSMLLLLLLLPDAPDIVVKSRLHVEHICHASHSQLQDPAQQDTTRNHYCSLP
jgi:hypothetical protein